MAKFHVEWGRRALDHPASTAIIVDCLSFSSGLNVACDRGADVYPFTFRDGAERFAELLGAKLARKRSEGGISLSPPSLNALEPGEAIVLPSPNGSTLSLFARHQYVLGGALRNARAVARKASENKGDVIIVAAGERWPSDGSLRPAFEDWVAAGAIAENMWDHAELSSEARLAAAAFCSVAGNLQHELSACQSGIELIERGFKEDVNWAAQLDASTCVPKLIQKSMSYGELGLERKDVSEPQILDMPISFYRAA